MAKTHFFVHFHLILLYKQEWNWNGISFNIKVNFQNYFVDFIVRKLPILTRVILNKLY